ncbi:MAG: CoA-transferase [Rhodospirillales bacterium]|jgi:glutaconate CoA-transferase subunit B|nr:CoA-transferase [Rhodospirillales bacterium]MDP6642658.1 CoA-transferase [Rhodospirillales bacterium]MDP6840171.1 CoA-transferase [Rhodospirillales bacterium]
MTGAANLQEMMIAAIARMLEGCGHVAVGTGSPVPGTATLLASKLSGGRMRVSVLGSQKECLWSDGGKELFDCAAQGRIDAFFLGGGQIDGQGNINLVGIGGYPVSKVRFPGSYGSAHLYFHVPKVILFREEHSPRVLVEKVDFISAPGVSEANLYRPGGPSALITGRALFAFDKERRRFRLESLHPGQKVDEVVAETGFAFDLPGGAVPETPPPSEDELALIRGDVGRLAAATYPIFAAEMLGIAA